MRKILHYGKKYILFVLWKINNMFSFFTKKQDLSNLKCKKKSDKVFIVCTGPSLTIDDLEKIKGYDSFSMNTICRLFDKTIYRPTYYVIQDLNVLEPIKKDINKSDLEEIIIGLGNYSKFNFCITKKDTKDITKKKSYFNLNYDSFNVYYRPNKIRYKFSKNCEKRVFDGTTITYSAIQLAVYLGYKEIYLLGCDCSNLGHFDEKLNNGICDPVAKTQYEGYRKVKEVCDALNVKVYNATRGGYLDIFPRVNLDEII